MASNLESHWPPELFPSERWGLVVFILVLVGLTAREMISEPTSETSDDDGLVVGTLFPITGDPGFIRSYPDGRGAAGGGGHQCGGRGARRRVDPP